jgi:hypothetical protein
MKNVHGTTNITNSVGGSMKIPCFPPQNMWWSFSIVYVWNGCMRGNTCIVHLSWVVNFVIESVLRRRPVRNVLLQHVNNIMQCHSWTSSARMKEAIWFNICTTQMTYQISVSIWSCSTTTPLWQLANKEWGEQNHWNLMMYATFNKSVPKPHPPTIFMNPDKNTNFGPISSTQRPILGWI